MAFGASNRVNVLRDALQTRLWPVPTVGVLLAVALGVLTPAVDTRVDDSVPPMLSAYLFGGGADAARTVLSAIAGSLITVTSLTFSLTVVTLQLASSQFSPRLLRTFSRDPFVHRTLALFLGTFAYSLVVLRTVRTSTNSRPEFVPKISITVAVVLTLVSVFALVLFLDHLATQIRVETMLDDVHTDASDTVRRVLQKRPERPATHPVPPQAPPTACPIEVAESGFLVSVDEDKLLSAACTAGAVVQIDGLPGGSLEDPQRPHPATRQRHPDPAVPPGAGRLRRCWAGRAGRWSTSRLCSTRRVYLRCMSRVRTNIELEDVHVQTIMDRFGVRTKTEAVALALQHLAGQPMTREEALRMRGARAIEEVPVDRSPEGAA